ncbi:hypothetical protein IR083_19890 [Dysgonomonas sp. GY75]|uniref:hypothetical protein n=1 Tax=Dysgonomonas sp. GY75 TaxID=2780419 RepID=UPI001883BF06|nr:hypothetical protein [Dysgonomonas sp. GY75]MBF0651082.1 hypothetical protein [Dysgonomonas sp. GY75]
MILDDILGKDKKKGADSFLPVAENNLDEQGMQAVNSHRLTQEADNMQATTPQNAINLQATGQQNEGIAAVKQSNLTAIGSNPAVVKYPDKPQGLNDGEYEHLLKYYPPEDISRFTAPFDPNGGENVLQRYYESVMPKPAAPDEKKVRNAQLIASIADGIGLLSQMYTYGKGAHVEKRDYNQSALSQVTGRAKELENRYIQQSTRYNDGLFNARLKDFRNALDDYNTGRKGLSGVLAAKQKLDQASEQFKEKQGFAYDKLAQEQQNKDKDLELRKQNNENLDRHRKVLEAQGWSRVADSRNRTSAYVKKASSSASGKNTNYRMVIEANPDDKEAVRDNQLGTNVRVFEMSKGEIDRYTREALSDPQFKAGHPQYDRKPGLLGEAPKSFTEKERTDIAAAYLQEQYNNSFTETPVVPDYATPSPGGSPVYQQWEQDYWLPRFGNNISPVTQPTVPSNLPVQEEDAEEAGIQEAEIPEDDEDEEFPDFGNMSNF